jgi:hypothetical protein
VPSAAAEAPRRRSAVPLALGAAALILLLAGVGFVLGHSGSKKASAAQPAGSVSNGTISIVPPAGWSKRAAPTIPGLQLTQSAAIGPTARSAGRPAAKSAGVLAWGQAGGVWPRYLPASFVKQLKSKSPLDQREVVKIGGKEALCYQGLYVKGASQPVNACVIPRGGTTPTLVCLTGSSSQVAATCESAVAGAQVKGSGYSVTPSPAYASAVTGAVKQSSKARNSGVAAMKKAGSAAKQASGARSIASAYDAAARTLKGATSSPFIAPANKKLLAAYSAAAAAYRNLAAAAAAKSGTRYAAAKQKVAKAEAQLQSALAALQQLGYTVK